MRISKVRGNDGRWRGDELIFHRWLLDNDHDEEGIVVIANLYGGGDIHNDKARQEYREIKMNVLMARQEGERSYSDMFRRYYKRVFIAMSAQGLAQLNGINVISYYAPLVFEAAGWHGRDAVLMTGINGITYLLATVPPWYLVDRWGRRFILLSGAVAMIISLSLISYFLFLQIRWTPRLVVIFVIIYNACFGASWGPIPWLYPPEILPLSIRAKGASLSTATNWAFNWLVGEVTPVLQEAITWRLYLVHAFFCAVSFVLGTPFPFSKHLLLKSPFPLMLWISSLLHLPRDRQPAPRGHGPALRRRHHRHADPRAGGRGRVAHERHALARALARHQPPPRRLHRRQRHPRPRYQPARGQGRGRRGERAPERAGHEWWGYWWGRRGDWGMDLADGESGSW